MISIYICYTDNFEDNLELSSQIGIIGSNFTLKFFTRTKFALDKNFSTQNAFYGPRDTKAHYCCVRKPSTDFKRCRC